MKNTPRLCFSPSLFSLHTFLFSPLSSLQEHNSCSTFEPEALSGGGLELLEAREELSVDPLLPARDELSHVV